MNELFVGYCVGGPYDGRWLTCEKNYYSWEEYPPVESPTNEVGAATVCIQRKAYVYKEFTKTKGLWIVRGEESESLLAIIEGLLCRKRSFRKKVQSSQPSTC